MPSYQESVIALWIVGGIAGMVLPMTFAAISWITKREGARR